MKKKMYGKLKSIKEICGLDLVELKYNDGSLYQKVMNDIAGEEFELQISDDNFFSYEIVTMQRVRLGVKKEWLKDIREEYEFEVDDKVWVRNYNEESWIARHISHVSEKQFACFVNGKSSFTLDGERDPNTCKWLQCIPNLYDGYNPNKSEVK